MDDLYKFMPFVGLALTAWWWWHLDPDWFRQRQFPRFQIVLIVIGLIALSAAAIRPDIIAGCLLVVIPACVGLAIISRINGDPPDG
jgi:hypothetical protein